jgi:hypothetical protein
MHCYYMFQPIVAIIRYTQFSTLTLISVCITYSVSIQKLCRLNNNKHCLTHNTTLQYNIYNLQLNFFFARENGIESIAEDFVLRG